MKLGVQKKKIKITAGRTVFRKSTPNLTITNGDFESNFEVLKKKIKKPLKVPSLARSVQCFFFFPVTPKSARDTPFVRICHGHFLLFTGTFFAIFSHFFAFFAGILHLQFCHGHFSIFTGSFSENVTGKAEIVTWKKKNIF